MNRALYRNIELDRRFLHIELDNNFYSSIKYHRADIELYLDISSLHRTLSIYVELFKNMIIELSSSPSNSISGIFLQKTQKFADPKISQKKHKCILLYVRNNQKNVNKGHPTRNERIIFLPIMLSPSKMVRKYVELDK